MWSIKLFLLALVCSTSAFPYHHSKPVAREYVDDDSRADAYDFVIAGGGQAGLSLAGLLSANSNFTVLVVEAGDVGPNQISASSRPFV